MHQPRSRHNLTPHLIHIRQCPPIADVIAHQYQIRREEGVVLGGRGVVELEAVGPVIHAYVEDEGLVEIAEFGEGVRGRDGAGDAAGAEGEFREEGGFAAGGVAEEEDRDGGGVGVHGVG